jgi:EamA-like transporter family
MGFFSAPKVLTSPSAFAADHTRRSTACTFRSICPPSAPLRSSILMNVSVRRTPWAVASASWHRASSANTSQRGKSGHGRPLAGLGIGLITGVGSLFYCFALDYLSVAMVVTFSNLYIVITTLLGIVVLGERVTALKIAGLATVNGLGTRCRGSRSGKYPRPRGADLL